MGISFAIDDFGTKYSSLAYLKILPIDKLKIDKSFVWGLPKDASGMKLASAIIAIASSMNLLVIAEGIETIEQADALRSKGCDFFQGFLFGPAVPPEELAGRLPRA
jgi:EAL domain-containing protein (putative c-di-GMP-specific phosphodiesterase class I)